MRWRWIAPVILLVLLTGGAALAEGPPPSGGTGLLIPQASLEAQSRQVDLSPVESYLKDVGRTWQGYGPDISLTDFLQLYKGGSDAKYSPKTIVGGLLRYLVREVLANTGLLLKLVVLAIMAALLQHLQSAFGSEGAGKWAYAVVYLVLMGMAVAGFGIAVAAAKGAIDGLSGFMQATLPVMLTVLAGMGGVTSAAIFHPIMLLLVTTAATTMSTVVFPLIFLSGVLEIVSGMNENLKLTHLAGLLKQGATIVMGLVTTVFLGTVAVKGAAGAVADGLAMKTAKFALGSFVPVVGKVLADATDLIMGSSILLKNALGVLGVAAVFFIAIFPLLKIMGLVLIYQLAAALVQPTGAGQVASMLTTMAKSLQQIFAAVAVVALMFFVAITVIVGSANLTVMMR